jgi:hypothetical protein
MRRSIFGSTFALWYGYRPGIQVNRQGGRSSMRSKVRTSWGDLGDRYTDASQEAENASHWRWGKPVRSRDDALVAARLAYVEAMKESGRDHHYQDLALKAAYVYSVTKMTTAGILQTVATTMRKDAPRTAQKVDVLLAAFRAKPAQPPPATRPAGAKKPRTVRYPVDPDPVPLPEDGMVEKARAALPIWAPWAAAGGLVLVAALLLRPSKVAA